MEFERISNSNDKRLQSLIKLMWEEFEPHQLRPDKQLYYIIDNYENHNFCAITYENKIVGVIVYWYLLNEFYYIEQFAIFKNSRGMKYGQKVLDKINNEIGGLWLLELDPIGDDIHNRLKKWYERNHFRVVEKVYDQPPYVPNEPTTPLWIMVNKDIEPEKLKKYL